jgi:hypothetical protein
MFLDRPFFKLWAKFECTPEENDLINKYQVSEWLLSEGKPGELKRAAIKAGILTIILAVALFLISIMFGLISFLQMIVQGGILIGAIIFFVCWSLIYHQIREQIRINDILAGRFFKCRSCLTLIIQEQQLAELGDCFRQLLEAMKNWGGREVIELRPYKAPALRIGKLS